jgi:hypothetical protein
MTLQHSRPLRTWIRLALIGAMIWCGLLIGLHPNPHDVRWARMLLLLAPLVLVPLGLGLWEQATKSSQLTAIRIFVKRFTLPAALLFAVAQGLDQGWLAASLALPWLLITGLIAVMGINDAWKNRHAPVDRLCIDAGLAYLAVGGAWGVIDRAGFRPLDFEPVIVMLTSIHFHFAGFVLPIVTALAAGRLGGTLGKLACIGVVAGMPLVAVGITGAKLGLRPEIETAAALWMSLAGGLSAVLLFCTAWNHRGARLISALWGLASIALAAGMILSAMYGSRHLLPMAWLDIPLMRITHGTANALGFALPAVVGWTLELYRATSKSFAGSLRSTHQSSGKSSHHSATAAG